MSDTEDIKYSVGAAHMWLPSGKDFKRIITDRVSGHGPSPHVVTSRPRQHNSDKKKINKFHIANKGNLG